MASKDFIYDLLEKVEEDGQEYVLLLPSRSSGKTQVDVYYSLMYEDTIGASINVMNKLNAELEKDLPDGFNEDDWNTEDEQGNEI